MENEKVPELMAEVKRLVLRGYSRSRKAELIDLLIHQNISIPLPRTKKIDGKVNLCMFKNQFLC